MVQLPIAIQPMYLWNIDGALCLLAAFCVLFIFGYLEFDKRRMAKQAYLSRIFTDLVSEIILCDNEEELKAALETDETKALLATYAHLSMAREVLCKELVRMHKNVSGIAAQNIQWLFARLQLQNDVFQQFKSSKWHVKAKAIQQLAEMQQKQYLTKIYRAINHPNYHVRMEAQLAIVKLTGFKGLRFLNVLRYPITAWQQLSLIQELSADAAIDPEKLKLWLRSENGTVAEFTLKLIRKYQCFELEEEIVACLQSPSSEVCYQARLILAENPDLNFKEAV